MESERDITTRISERQMRLWNALHSTGHSKNIRQQLLAIDTERRAFIRHRFRQDYDDFRFYHAIFNTDHLSVERVVSSSCRCWIRSMQIRHSKLTCKS